MEKDIDTRKAKDDIIPEFGDLDFESEREEEQRRLERERQERERESERQDEAAVATGNGRPSSAAAGSKTAAPSGRGAARGGRRGRPARDVTAPRTRPVLLDQDTACLLGMAAVRLSYLRDRRVSRGEIVREALDAYLRKEAPEVLRTAGPADGAGTEA